MQSSKKLKKAICVISFLLLFISQSSLWAMDRISRLGLGFSGQMKNDLPGLSFKLQRSKSFTFGGILGFSNSENNAGYSAGLKVYRNIFDEPNLSFYASFMGGLLSKKMDGQSHSGFQADLTLGSEFSFQALQSLGFSLEFGVSFYKLDSFITETVGNNFLISAVHFYL